MKSVFSHVQQVLEACPEKLRRTARKIAVTALGLTVIAPFCPPVFAQAVRGDCVNTGGGFTAGPGRDGSPSTALTGVVNAYFQGNSVAAITGGSRVTVNSSTPRALTATDGTGFTGTQVFPTAGDMVLVIQMQGVSGLDETNTATYGAATLGNTATNSAGTYEFARVFASNAGANTIDVQTTAAGGALTGNYSRNTTNSTQRRFQVVRVPQYFNVGIGTGLTCAYWDGETGGVLALDIRGTCQFTISATNGTVNVAGRGFRGGGGRRLNGGSTLAQNGSADFSTFRAPSEVTGWVNPIGAVSFSAANLIGANGSKGEGIAGTPRYVSNLQSQTATPQYASIIRNATEGFTNGSSGRGALGNAGGGASDNEPTAAQPGGNGLNSGGGGGGNCGAGGQGGNCWNNTSGATNGPDGGGRGGRAISAGNFGIGLSATRIFLGGGGGAGTVNNGAAGTETGVPANDSAINTDVTNRDGRTSSGAPGGGIVIIRAAVFYGTGTINANGLDGRSAGPDGGGGGGAGGTVIMTATSTAPVSPGPANLTITANGGNGGDSFRFDANAASRPHGPGGGGGGGAIFTTSTVGTVSATVSGGTAGVTRTGSPVALASYGAANGAAGTCNNTALTITGIPGTPSGPECNPPIVTEAHVVDFSAVSYANGEVGLSWNTSFEADNLGFRVWREVNGKRELVTGNGLVAGSALMAGTTLTAGNRYAWRDGAVTRGKAGATVAYWLEDIDLNGKSSWNGPFELRTSKEPMPESLRNAPLLGRNNPVFGSQTTKSLASPDPMELNRYLAESAAVQTSAKSATSSAFQQALAAGPAVKLGVRTTGWQSISRSALVGAGLNPAAVDANLKMYVNSTEVPIRVSANAVEFFGVAADTLQSGEQTYWLVEGTSAGLRIPTTPAGAGSRLGVASFVSLVERRDRTTYFAALQNGDADNFFGAVVSNSPVDQALTVKNRDASATFPAQVAVTLQGVSQTDHRVSVKLNGQTIGEVNYANRDQQTFTTTVAQSQLLEGQNTVTLQSAEGSDVNLVAAVRISYARSFIADADALSLSGRAGQSLTVRGFSQTPRVFDVTDPASPVEVFVRADGTGNVSASFVVPGTAGSTRQLLAATSSRFLTPTVTSNTPSTLSATTNAADFVIITTPDLAPALTPLVQLRQSQGLTVKVVDVTDIYDEFSFGVKSAQAVKDFLNLASHTWQTPVRYAMFAGDASFDPRDFLGFNQDVIPTKLLGLGTLETASDDWFGDFNDSGLSEIAIGRLPGRSQADIAAMVAKIVAYDQANGQSWQRDALVIADNNDDGGDFEADADGVEADLPASFVKTSVRVGQIGGGTARTQILSALNDGKGLVNYSGHGSVSNWAGENLLTSDDVANLTNTTRPSIVVSMTCLNGFFHDPYSVNLGKSLIRANSKGAAAVLASSSLTLSPDQGTLNRALIQALYGGTSPVRLGDAIRQAKASTNDPNVRQSFILFGDPAMNAR